MENKSILIFGAGKIGRSFIGQIFGLSGFEVVFSDVDATLINELNKQKSYRVIIKSEVEKTLIIPNVRAVSGFDRTQVVKEISGASILAVCVGKNALEKIIPVIAEGLQMKLAEHPGLPTDIIIAENMRSAGEFFRKKLSGCLPEKFPVDELVGLVETSIGKMVPIMQQADIENDPLLVFAEPYNNLIVDKNGFKGKIPVVNGLYPKENIKAWVDRKAFIHNLGHATVAYFGAFKYPAAKYIFEVLDDPAVYQFAKDTMIQSAEILQFIYPDEFTHDELMQHINNLLFRFQNKALKDTIYRVGQDRPRKLSPDDRFVGIIRLAQNVQMKYNKILEAMAFAFYFKASGEDGFQSDADLEFDRLLLSGVDFTLEKVCGFIPEKDEVLITEFKQYFRNIKTKLEKN